MFLAKSCGAEDLAEAETAALVHTRASARHWSLDSLRTEAVAGGRRGQRGSREMGGRGRAHGWFVWNSISLWQRRLLAVQRPF